MPTLSKRVWKLPNGEDWVTWRVEWKEFGQPRRKPFLKFGEAVAFLAQLGKELKLRKSYTRKPATVDRVVRPRAHGAKVIPFPRRRA
jgi:hypothetical protein